jgi:D-glycero-alpha-D-manno-heptose-7-phosphate kinase
MRISRTPFRISFFSGGSDIPSFYRTGYGAALSATIDKYVYVTTHTTKYSGFRTMYDTISYQETDEIDKIEHAITREALKYYGIEDSIVVSSVSDIPSRGSGLGSSSAFTVGLLNCLEAQGSDGSREDLAEEACKIEIGRCGYPIGKQDQYAAAVGGFNLYKFNDDGVDITPIRLRPNILNKLQSNLLLMYSGVGRSANEILKKQSQAINSVDKRALIEQNRDAAIVAAIELINGNTDALGEMFHEAWMRKKEIVSGISNSYFDDVYELALRHGAVGGKLLGAGGGGFFLFYCKDTLASIDVAYKLKEATKCTWYEFNFEKEGSTIIADC